jgi:hypothetical protein
MYSSTLAGFRDGLYLCFERAGDALLDLADALLSETASKSLPELSLSPLFRRQWPSLYAVLQDAKIHREHLRRLFAAFAPLPEAGQRLVVGLDASPIARPHSQTARDRTHVHAPNLPPGCKPVTVGWQYSSLVVLPACPSSFVYLLDTLRIQSHQTPAQVGAAQVQQILPRLPQRALLLGDRYYSSLTFFSQVAGVACDKLLRLQKHRVLYRPAPPKREGPGRPKEHGARFQPKDETTQGCPDATWEGVDSEGRCVTLACWNNLHFRALKQTPVSVVRVVRPHAKDTKRDPKVSWYLWQAETPPPLPEVVGLYRLRFSQEHGYRYQKGSLLWATPHLRTPEQFEVWTRLVAAVMNQLVLARALGGAVLHPWQSGKRPVTPEQVRRGMGRILSELGTPACAPQRRGNAPGRLPGTVVAPAPRFEVILKSRPKRTKRRRKAKKALKIV